MDTGTMLGAHDTWDGQSDLANLLFSVEVIIQAKCILPMLLSGYLVGLSKY